MKKDRRKRHNRNTFTAAFLVAAALVAPVVSMALPSPTPTAVGPDCNTSLPLRIKPLPDGVRKVHLTTDEHGEHRFVLLKLDGSEERLNPNEFAIRLDRDHSDERRLYTLLNITSPIGIAWVVLGLAGQVLFAGRMIVQWLVSEQNRRSVVPIAFWWMSLAGASMLLVYFIWRRDIVGVMGQSVGWLVYCRNLWLIRRNRQSLTP